MNNKTEANSYIWGDDQQDRTRLNMQTKLLGRYNSEHARALCGDDIHSIIDVGCGEGQLGLTLLETYPDACLLGIDRDGGAIAHANKAAQEHGLDARL